MNVFDKAKSRVSFTHKNHKLNYLIKLFHKHIIDQQKENLIIFLTVFILFKNNYWLKSYC